MMNNYCKFLLSLFFLFSTTAFADNNSDSTSRSKKNTGADSTKKAKKNTRLELSFGNSQIFVSDSQTVRIRNSNNIVLATHAMLFFAEFRPTKKIRFPIFFNLPTESKQFLVNGVLVYERASPTLGFGVQYNCVHLNMNDRSAFEFDAGPNISFLLEKSGTIRYAPIFAGRIRLLRDKNLVMYMGSSYSLGLNAFGLFYGTGFFF